jgi:hypothetical protein
LTHDGTVPTSVVVDVNNAKRGTRVQATLNQSIVGLPVVGIEGATKVVVEKELPSDYWTKNPRSAKFLVHRRVCLKLTRDSEGVQAIVVDEVLDLVDASLTGVCDARSLARAINGAAEIETCNLFNEYG